MIGCPVCGATGAACHGDTPVILTPDQLADIGLKPEKLEPGGTIVMTDSTEPKGRYPKQDVAEGQEAGYIGEIEVYEPAHQEAGFSNAADPAEVAKPGKGKMTSKTAADSAPEEKPVVGETGTTDANA